MRFAHDEPLHGTAPERAQSWLLVEHPGPWPSRGLPPDMPSAVAAVWDEVLDAGVRPQLVRRVRDRRRSTSMVMTASCRAGSTWLERVALADLRDLSGLDVATLGAGRPPGFGQLSEERVFLVCTHGHRDVCCARLGRPAAVLLDRALPDQVWETNHVGGDRFAANVVTLPEGSYHGGVMGPDIDRLAAAVSSGGVLLSRLRGRAGLEAPVQAADYYLRQECGITALTAIRPLQHESAADEGMVCVELQVDGGEQYRVYVRPRQYEQVRLTSCAGPGTFGAPTTFDLVTLEPMVSQTARRPTSE